MGRHVDGDAPRLVAGFAGSDCLEDVTAVFLGCGIGAVTIAAITSAAFVYATLTIWKLEYGKTLAGPFLTMLTRRDAGEDDYE